MTAYGMNLLAEAERVKDTVVVSGEGMRLYRGLDPVAEVEVLLTVWPDGVREVATRPAHSDGWTAWSPPIYLDGKPIAEVAR